MTQPIAGKVASVVNDRTVLINRGVKDGVETGMIFKIFGPDQIEVRDPDTEEVLESVTLVKVLVKVVDVSDRISVARTYRVTRKNVGGLGFSVNSIARMFEPPKYEETIETLRFDPTKGREMYDGESVVSVGDSVLSLADGEEAGTIVILD